MQNLITTPADYWIAPNAVSIALNALGDANRIQCSVASGAVIMCFIDEIRAETDGGEEGNGDGLWYGANHEPRRWPLSISPTYFNSDTRKYVYAAIPRSTTVGTQAVIVFPSDQLDIYGRVPTVPDASPSDSSSSSSDADITYEQIGSTDFFYVYLGGIISAVETVNSTEQRRWETRITDWGTLETPQGRDESFSKYTFWGQSVNANNQVIGPLAGSIDFIEFANGVRLGVDTADNTLKVYMPNNQQAHLFSTGAVSAFGPSALGGGGGDLILGPLLSALNAEPMPTDDGYLHWTGSAFEWVEPGGGGEMPSTVAWNNITGKPSTFAPSEHTHLKEDITDFDHNHDDRYYTESEMDGFLAAKLAKPSQGTYTKLTVASGGGVTWGTLSASDIPSLTKSKISDFPTQWAWSAISGAPFTGDVANSAAKLSDTAAYTAWGRTFFTGGKPASVSGDLDNVANITMSGHISINSFIVEKTNDGLKHNGNILATGAVSALGISAQGSTSGALSLLTDVNISGTPANGYVLTYDSTSGKWTPQATQATDLTAYATKTWVGQQGFLTSSAISDMATKTWVGQQGFLTSSAISDMATKTWVGQQGFLTSSAISDMATKTWVGQQGFLTSSAISDMATKTWVGQQGFLTGITSNMVTTALGFTPLSNATTFWGRTASNGVVSGSMTDVGSITMSGHISINSFIVEKTNDGLKHNGNILATGAVSALGISAQGSTSGALSLLTDVNISGTPANGYVLTYDSTSGKWTPQATQATDLTAYATKEWVGQQGYVTSSGVTSVTAGTGLSGGTITASGTIAINSTYQTYISNGNTAYGWGNHANAGYATQTWVGQQGFLTSSAISDMATKTWVGQQGFLTGITSSMVTTALGFTPLSNATTFWGRTASNGVVSGSMTGVGSITMSGSLSINSFIVEKTNDGLKHNGNILATGAVSALGLSAQGSNSGALSLLTDVNISGTPTNGYVLTYDSTSGKWTPQATQATDLSAYATRQWVEQNWLVKNAVVNQSAAPPAVNPGEPLRSYKQVVTDVSQSSGTLQFTKEYIKDTFAKADIVDFAHTHYTWEIDGLSNYALSSEVSQLRSDIGCVVSDFYFSGDNFVVEYNNVDGYPIAVKPQTVPFATRTMGFKRLNVTGSQTADANTMTVGGVEYALLANYASTNLWSNMPSGMSCGNVLQLTSPTSLDGQLAWDSNHGVTTGVTRKLYWRSRNDSGWGTNGWHTIAFEDWVTTQLNTLGDSLQTYVTTQLAGYLPLTAGSSKPLTGDLWLNGNLVAGNPDNTTNDDSAKIAFYTNKNYPNISPYIQAINEANYGRKRLSVFQKNAEDWNTPQTEVLSVMPDGTLRLTQAISFKGTKATKEMIAFIDNKSDQWGNGIAIGGGGATIIGGGESAATMIGQLPKVTVDGVENINGGSEVMYIGNDTSVSIFTNLGTASGLANRKEFVFTTEGNLFLPKRSDNGCLWLSSIGAMNFNAGTGGWATQFMALNTSTAANLGGCGMFGENNSLTYFYIGQAYNNTWAVVKPNGNVGIGTTSPSCKLDVNGAAYLSGDNSNYGIILANDKAISLKDSGGTIRRALFLNANNQLAIGYGTTKGGTAANQYDTAIFGRFISFGTGGGSNTDPAIRMTISSAGNVGIGTNNPQHKLHVAGNVVATGAVSALGVSSQGTAVGAVAADTLQVLGTSTLNGATTINNTLTVRGNFFSTETTTNLLYVESRSEFADDIMIDGKLIFGTGTSDDCIYADSGHLYFKPAGGTAVQIA